MHSLSRPGLDSLLQAVRPFSSLAYIKIFKDAKRRFKAINQPVITEIAYIIIRLFNILMMLFFFTGKLRPD